MALDSFFHEMALREVSAGRGQVLGKPPLWWRLKAWVTPRVVRAGLTVAVVLLVILAGVFHEALGRYLRGRSPHGPGAADSLATVARRATPVERLRRLAVACARENDPLGCQRAIERGAKQADLSVVLAWLKHPEVRRLRENDFFDEFILRLETRRQAGTIDQARPLRPQDVP